LIYIHQTSELKKKVLLKFDFKCFNRYEAHPSHGFTESRPAEDYCRAPARRTKSVTTIILSSKYWSVQSQRVIGVGAKAPTKLLNRSNTLIPDK